MQESSTHIATIHESFVLNSKSFTITTLEAYAHKLVRSGEVYEAKIGEFLLDWLDDGEYITAHTSGSTGAPKSIKIRKKHMINSALATAKFFKLQNGTTALLCLSAEFIAGKMMLVRAMVLGWKLDMVPPKSNPLERLYRHYDFCAMVPMQLDNSINRLHLIKKLIVGGGQISEYIVALVSGIETKVYETYGMTETVTHIAARRVNSKKKSFDETHFKALPQIALSTDHRNCLVIKAPMISDEVIITNDIVDLFSYKKFRWKGRFDNVINSGAIKLYPEEIERKIQVVIRERFIVSWIPHNTLGQQLVLIVEDPTTEATEKVVFNKIKLLETLKKYEIPKKIFFLETFKETGSGKIHRENNRQIVISRLNL